jgi:AcrR family transcriptional regulator
MSPARASGVVPLESATDGRLQRTLRSRQAILDAFYELIEEGVLQPTAGQVAERAGVGIRSVFRHFSEMEALFAELNERLRSENRAWFELERPEGSLEQRARALVASRCEIFERVAPFVRATRLHRLRSDFLTKEYLRGGRELRSMLRDWLPELGAAPRPLSEAIEAVVSFELWDRLRSEQRLGAARTAEAMEYALLGLISQLSG